MKAGAVLSAFAVVLLRFAFAIPSPLPPSSTIPPTLDLNSSLAGTRYQQSTIQCGTPYILSGSTTRQEWCWEAATEIAFVRDRRGKLIDRRGQLVNLASGGHSSWTSSNQACRIVWFTRSTTEGTVPLTRSVTRGRLYAAAMELITRCTRDRASYRFEGTAEVSPEDPAGGYGANLLHLRLDAIKAIPVLADPAGNSTLRTE